MTFCNQLEAAVLCLPLGAKPLLIFSVGASDGAIEAGAAVLDTVVWVGGVKDPRGVDSNWVGASQFDWFSPSAACHIHPHLHQD